MDEAVTLAGGPGAAKATVQKNGGPATKGVAFLVSLHVKAGREEEFLNLLEPVLDAMRHEASFVNAVLHRDPENPSRFMLYETWTDLEDVTEVQIHRDYRKEYWARLPELLREPRRIETWQPLRADHVLLSA
jgi:quinol monooxygenase YgiN